MVEERKIGEGTSSMPEPQTMEYSQIFKITPIFMHDLETVLGELAYVEAKKYLDRAKANSGIMPIATLTEFINSLMTLPYHVIAPLIAAISQKDKFEKYFETIKQ